MIDENPIDADLQLGDDDVIDRSLRPEYLQDFVGQPKLKEQLSIFIQAARTRKESLDHVLLFGPPGLGKTTLSNICLLYTSPSPRDLSTSRMPSSA